MFRYYIYAFFLIGTVLFTVACRTKLPVSNAPAPASSWISGAVIEIQMGKDGFTATIASRDKKIYHVTISRANLDKPEQYRSLSVGDKVTLRGDRWQMDGEHITVRELK